MYTYEKKGLFLSYAHRTSNLKPVLSLGMIPALERIIRCQTTKSADPEVAEFFNSSVPSNFSPIQTQVAQSLFAPLSAQKLITKNELDALINLKTYLEDLIQNIIPESPGFKYFSSQTRELTVMGGVLGSNFATFHDLGIQHITNSIIAEPEFVPSTITHLSPILDWPNVKYGMIHSGARSTLIKDQFFQLPVDIIKSSLESTHKTAFLSLLHSLNSIKKRQRDDGSWLSVVKLALFQQQNQSKYILDEIKEYIKNPDQALLKISSILSSDQNIVQHVLSQSISCDESITSCSSILNVDDSGNTGVDSEKVFRLRLDRFGELFMAHLAATPRQIKPKQEKEGASQLPASAYPLKELSDLKDKYRMALPVLKKLDCQTDLITNYIQNLSKICSIYHDVNNGKIIESEVHLSDELGKGQAYMIFSNQHNGYLNHASQFTGIAGAQLFETSRIAKKTLQAKKSTANCTYFDDCLIVACQISISPHPVKECGPQPTMNEDLAGAIAYAEKEYIQNALMQADLNDLKSRIKDFESEVETNPEAPPVAPKKRKL